MSIPIVQLANPRTPLQSRGQARFDLVLEASRALLQEKGLDGFSIPALASRLGMTRASIYNFFPTPYAVLNALAQRELDALEARLMRLAAEAPDLGWRERVSRTVAAAAQFYQERPVARSVILGNSVTDEGCRARALTLQRLSGLSQALFDAAGTTLPRDPVPVMALAVELAMTCLRQSVLLHDQITAAHAREAARIMVSYLEPYVRR